MSRWDERYAAPGYAYGTEPNDFLAAQAGRIPPGPVLCLAEGEGRNAVFLAQRGRAVHAVDLSPVGLAKARALAARRGVQVGTEVADLGTLRLAPSAWAGIVSIFAHVPSAARRALHAQVAQALVPGGLFILEAYTARQPDSGGRGGPPREQADLFMSLEALRAELQGLVFLHALETVREVNEGEFHAGPGAVVQLVAQRPA